MTVQRLLAMVLALCLFGLVFCGCTGAGSTQPNAEPADGEAVYLLTMLEQKNEQGEVVIRTTYTYNEQGFVVARDKDENGVPEQVGNIEVFTRVPCDGVIDEHREYTYDSHGNLTLISSQYEDSYSEIRYEYTYDDDDRVVSVVCSSPESRCDVEYNADNTAEFTTNYDDPRTVQVKFDDAGRIAQVYISENQTVFYEYTADGQLANWKCLNKDGHTVFSHTYAYDEVGRMTQEDYSGAIDYQYEDDMLVAVGNRQLSGTKQEDGTLVVQCGKFMLTYTSVTMNGQDADMARYNWNRTFGRLWANPLEYKESVCLHDPMYDYDTVLPLPEEIYNG